MDFSVMEGVRDAHRNTVEKCRAQSKADVKTYDTQFVELKNQN